MLGFTAAGVLVAAMGIQYLDVWQAKYRIILLLIIFIAGGCLLGPTTASP